MQLHFRASTTLDDRAPSNQEGQQHATTYSLLSLLAGLERLPNAVAVGLVGLIMSRVVLGFGHLVCDR